MCNVQYSKLLKQLRVQIAVDDGAIVVVVAIKGP